MDKHLDRLDIWDQERKSIFYVWTYMKMNPVDSPSDVLEDWFEWHVQVTTSDTLWGPENDMEVMLYIEVNLWHLYFKYSFDL